MATTLGTTTYGGGSLQVTRKITCNVGGTGGGLISVPHGMSYTPTDVQVGIIYDSSTPGAGIGVYLDTTSVAAGMDGSYIYLYVTAGPGQFTLKVT